MPPKTTISTLITTICLILLQITASAQVLQVSDITISGNRKTKPAIILCEMEVQAGDTVSASRLTKVLGKSQENLLKTSLFHYVTLTPEYSQMDSASVTININVEERWYLWPNANITPHNGNLNDWLSDPDLSLIDYCVGLKKYNFRGRKEAVFINLRRGFNNITQIGYENIAVDRKRRHLLSASASIKRQKSLILRIEDNKAKYQEFDGIKKAISQYAYDISYRYRPSINVSHQLKAGYISARVCDSVVLLNPDFFGQGKKRIEGIILEYMIRIDNRSSNYYPLSGSFLSSVWQQKGLFSNTLNIYSANIDIRKYCVIAPRLYFATQAYASISNKEIPFNLMEAIGYKPNILKGYEHNMIAGRNLIYLNTSYKWEIVKPHIWHIKRINMPRFNKIHYAIYLNTFANAGYVSPKNGDARLGNTMNDSMLGAIGTGLDFVTYYDRVLTAYVAHNIQGDTYFGVGFKTAF